MARLLLIYIMKGVFVSKDTTVITRERMIMRKCCLAIIIVIVAIFCMASQAHAAVFVEGWNIEAPPASSTWGLTQVAWKYIPTVTYDLSRVEFYCGYQNRDNVTIELREDNSDSVGSVLTSGVFNHSATSGWQGANLTPYTVTEDQAYWVAFWYCGGLRTSITRSTSSQYVLSLIHI